MSLEQGRVVHISRSLRAELLKDRG